MACRYRQGIPAVLLVALLAACAPAANPAPSPAQGAASAAPASELARVLEAARKEASEGPLFVSITQPNQDATYQALFDAFNKRFGLNVRYEWQAHQRDYYGVVVAEAQAGRRTPDVISGSPQSLTTLDDAGLFEPHDWLGTFGQELPGIVEAVERTIPSYRNKLLAHFDVIYVMVYNTSQVTADRVPRTVEGLALPEWNRKFAVNAQGAPLDDLSLAVGRERAVDLARQLRANRPIYKRGQPAAVAAVATGEAAIGVGYTTGADLEKSKGAPIDWLPWQDYVPVLQQNMSVLKSAQRPNLARLFAAWMVSDGMELQEKLEFMGRATARGTPTWERLQQYAPNARIVEIKSDEDIQLRNAVSQEIVAIFTE